MAARRLTVEILGEARQLNRTLNQVDTRLDKFGRNADRVSKGVAAIGAGFVASRIVQGLNRATQAASDLNETQTKTQVVFGKSADIVFRFGQTSAKSVGLSTQAAEEAAATFGNLFVAMKIGQRPAADMSVGLVKLAGDLASFNNVDPTQVLEDLRSGLTGEVEPLRKYGVALNAASVEQEAMRATGKKNVAQLTEADKVTARYALILQNTKTAQGDFARTSDGLANQQRILNAQWKDAQAQFGKALLPAMKEAVGVASKLASGFADLDKSTGGLASKLSLGALGLAALGVGVGKTLQFVNDSKAAWKALRAAKLANVAATPAVVAAEAATGTAATASGVAASTAATRWVALKASLAGLASTAAAAAAPLVAVGGAVAIALGAGGSEDQRRFEKQADGLSKATREWYETIKARNLYNQLSERDKATFDEIEAKIRKTTEAIKQQGAATTAAGRAAATGATNFKGLAESFKPLHEVLATARDDILGVADGFEHGKRASSVSARAIIGDLNNEVATLKTWAGDAQRLLRRGMDPAAVEFLSKKGPEFLHAFATGSDAQVASFERLFKGRVNAAADAAWVSSVRSTSAFKDFRAKSNAEIAKISNKPAREKLSQLLGDLSAGKIGITEFRRRWNEELAKLKNAERIASVIARLKSPEVLKSDINKAKNLIGLGATGGAVRGPGTETSDSVPFLLSTGEHIVSAREVRGAGGHKALERQRAMWRDGIGVPGLAKGGPAFRVKSSGLSGLGERLQAQTGAVDRFVAGIGRTLGTMANQQLNKEINAALNALGGGTGPGGVSWMMRALRSAFPGLPLISGFRRGAITATGNRSYHASGRAVDVPPSMAVFNWIRSHYGQRTRELIFSPAGNRQIHNGRPHYYTGITRAQHFNHVHWAYRKGGTLPEDIYGVGRSGATYSMHRGETVTPRGGGPVTIEKGAVQVNVYGAPGQSEERLGEIVDAHVRAAFGSVLGSVRARRAR